MVTIKLRTGNLIGLCLLVALGLCFLSSGPVLADQRIASIHFNDARLVGKARLKYIIWNVFDAELYAPSGEWKSEEPFALTLRYLRDISGKSIVKQSISEIQKQGFTNEEVLENWRQQMGGLFLDVSKGTYITGVNDSDGAAIFYRDGAKIGQIDDSEFARRFFDIWLGKGASDRRFRQRLVGTGR